MPGIGIGIGIPGGSMGSGLAPTFTNMVAWYRKGVGITSAANAVSNWADQSGLGSRDLSQATAAAKPTLQGDGTILWNGTSNFLKTASFALANPCTIYLRMKQVTWASGNYVFDGNGVNSGVMAQVGVTPQLELYNGTFVSPNTAVAVGSWTSVAAQFNGLSSLIDANGTISANGDTGIATLSGLTVGASGAGTGQFSNIQVAEIIVYNVAHTALQRSAVFSYTNTL
jgi:hypothetical protein